MAGWNHEFTSMTLLMVSSDQQMLRNCIPEYAKYGSLSLLQCWSKFVPPIVKAELTNSWPQPDTDLKIWIINFFFCPLCNVKISVQLCNKHLEDWRQTVRSTNFLAEIVFWEFSFFIRNDNKLAFLEKNPLKHALFTLQHYPSSWQQ